MRGVDILNKFKRLKNVFLHRAVLITVLSALTFILPSLLDIYVRKNFKLSPEHRELATIGFSLFVILLNLLIVRKWLSFKQVGLQKSGLAKSLLYSLIFIALLRAVDNFSYREVFKNITWNRQFILYLSTHIFLAFQEELMFRGVIFRVWQKWKGFLPALFVSSILFGLEHLVYPVLGFETVKSLESIVGITFFGPALALIVYRTKNIWGLTIAHFLYNASVLITEESVSKDIVAKNSLIMIVAGVYIFLPIIIDFLDRQIFRLKLKKIGWNRYLAWLFVIFFILLTIIFAYDDFGSQTTEGKSCPYLDNENVKTCLEENSEQIDDCYNVDLHLQEERVANITPYIINKKENGTGFPDRSTIEKYQVLRKLSVSVQITYFENLLGFPTYINEIGRERKEYIYVDKDYYVQALVGGKGKEGTVLSYAVVSRRKDFNPTFALEGIFNVTLNKTPFSEWDIFHDGRAGICYRFLGAHDPLYYFEEAYFANPGYYLTYLVGINNSASFAELPDLNEKAVAMSDGPVDCETISQNDREKIPPNTFIVRSMALDVDEAEIKRDPGVYFGPDNILLRTLNE